MADRMHPLDLRAHVAAGMFTRGTYMDAFGQASHFLSMQESVSLADKILSELDRTAPKAESFCDAVEIAALGREADALADDAVEWQTRAESAEAQAENQAFCLQATLEENQALKDRLAVFDFARASLLPPMPEHCYRPTMILRTPPGVVNYLERLEDWGRSAQDAVAALKVELASVRESLEARTEALDRVCRERDTAARGEDEAALAERERIANLLDRTVNKGGIPYALARWDEDEASLGKTALNRVEILSALTPKEDSNG